MSKIGHEIEKRLIAGAWIGAEYAIVLFALAGFLRKVAHSKPRPGSTRTIGLVSLAELSARITKLVATTALGGSIVAGLGVLSYWHLLPEDETDPLRLQDQVTQRRLIAGLFGLVELGIAAAACRAIASSLKQILPSASNTAGESDQPDDRSTSNGFLIATMRPFLAAMLLGVLTFAYATLGVHVHATAFNEFDRQLTTWVFAVTGVISLAFAVAIVVLHSRNVR